MHLALYGLMAVAPLAGWAEPAHKTAAFSLAGGLVLPLPDAHAAAALVQHYVLRDATLVRMLPRRC